MRDARCEVGSELQSAAGAIALDHVVEARLVNGDFAALEHGDLAWVHVHAQHVIAHVGEAGASDQPDVAGAENRDFHVRIALAFYVIQSRFFGQHHQFRFRRAVGQAQRQQQQQTTEPGSQTGSNPDLQNLVQVSDWSQPQSTDQKPQQRLPPADTPPVAAL